MVTKSERIGEEMTKQDAEKIRQIKLEYQKSAYEKMAQRLLVTALLQSIAIIANSVAIIFIVMKLKGL